MSALNPGVLVCPQKESGQATAPLSQRIRPGGVQLRRQQRKKKEKKKRKEGDRSRLRVQRETRKKTDGRGKSWEKENQLGRISLTEMSPTSTSWHVFVRTQSKKSDRGNGQKKSNCGKPQVSTEGNLSSDTNHFRFCATSQGCTVLGKTIITLILFNIDSVIFCDDYLSILVFKKN